MALTHEILAVYQVPDKRELAEALFGRNKPRTCTIQLDYDVPAVDVEFRVRSIERLQGDTPWAVRVVGEILSCGKRDWESLASRIQIDCNPGLSGVCDIGDWPVDDEE